MGTNSGAAAGQAGSVAASAATAERVLALVNLERLRVGCPAVHEHPALERAAERHSAEMATGGRLTHMGRGGVSVGERLHDSGYENEYYGENVARGSQNAPSVVRSWMNSPDHREIILTCTYREAGVGISHGPDGPWWTFILGAAHA
ncbi:CAP domain-containing protein [Streptomyces sp. NPDC057445]|uniref:CAP domain-containing protein n=1 Tax=Streptomyces sp. NPDC057445 TaxID=3346136 RepID=UPI0036AC6F5A